MRSSRLRSANFYQLVSRGVIAKTEGEYKCTVVRLLAAMRRAGEIPFGWIADNARWMRKPRSHSYPGDMLERRSDSIGGPCGTTRMSTSRSGSKRTPSGRTLPGHRRVRRAANGDPWLPFHLLSLRGGRGHRRHRQAGVPLLLWRLRSLWLRHNAGRRGGIREFAPDADIHFERVAVTPAQIAAWSLPSRPTKQSDSRSEGFAGNSVEVDSIPPDTLRDLVRHSIVRHIDARQMAASLVIEEQERETLRRIISNLGSAA